MPDWSELGQAGFWVAALKIVWINILLSGDNAIVIAMACRTLPPQQRLWGMTLGAGAAVVLCVAFTGAVAWLMELPYLKLVGGLALIVIAAGLLVPSTGGDDGVESTGHLWSAVRLIAVAETSMSLDNVIATATAARGNKALLVLGLSVSIPLIVAGAALIRAMLERFTVLVWAGAALLGGIAGESIASDTAIEPYLPARLGVAAAQFITWSAPLICAVIVLVIGTLWRRTRQLAAEHR